MLPVVDAEKCIGCGLCEIACPVEAIVITDGVATIDTSLCTRCASCTVACTSGAVVFQEVK